MSLLLSEMQSRLGTVEIRGNKHNPTIVKWFSNVGHPEIKDDETSYCSVGLADAALTVGLPIPRHEVVMMARSWLDWGIEVEKNAAAIQAALDDGYDVVAIWPRGDPQGWQGHVNIVETTVGARVVCVGANQRVPGKNYDGVTRAKPRAIKEAIGFRRSVPATRKDLKEAGSKEITVADATVKIATGGAVVTTVAKTADETGMLEPIKDVSTNVGIITNLLSGVQSLGKLVAANVGLSSLVLLVVAAFVARWWIKRRLARHAQGQPLTS